MEQGSFLLSVQELKKEVRRYECGVLKIKAQLESVEADALENLIMETQVSTRRISEMLKSHEFIIGDSVIWKHRRKACACFREAK